MQITRLAQSRFRVMSEQRRDLERDPAIDSGSALMNRTKQVGGPGDVLQCDLEEQLLARFSRPQPLADGGVAAS